MHKISRKEIDPKFCIVSKNVKLNDVKTSSPANQNGQACSHGWSVEIFLSSLRLLVRLHLLILDAVLVGLLLELLRSLHSLLVHQCAAAGEIRIATWHSVRVR